MYVSFVLSFVHELGMIDVLGDNHRRFARAGSRERCAYQFIAARSGYALVEVVRNAAALESTQAVGA